MSDTNKLEDINLDNHSYADIANLARRCVKTVGLFGSWDILDEIASCSPVSPRDPVFIAVRMSPDDPHTVQSVGRSPTIHPQQGFAQLPEVTVPMLAMMTMQHADYVREVAMNTGIGPNGLTEMIAKKCVQIHKAKGGGELGGFYPFGM